MPASKIQWLLIFGTAVLLEIALIAALIPIGLLIHSQALRIPLACLVVGFLVTLSFGRWIRSRFIVHGVLIGVVATGVYLALLAVLGGGVAQTISRYGLGLFLVFNLLRIVGTTAAGAVWHKRSSVASTHTLATSL